jgi:uncharacterized protein YdaU (DUF1376 family)
MWRAMRSAEFPAMPLWVDSFAADTASMSVSETGAYIMLLTTMWRAGGALPLDDKRLARWAKSTPAQWRRVKPVLLEFFHIEGGVLTHNQLLKSMAAVRQRSQSASRSAHAKWLKIKGPAHAFALPTHSERNAIGMLLKTREEESFINGSDRAHEEEGKREDGGGPIEVSDSLRKSRVVRGGR